MRKKLLFILVFLVLMQTVLSFDASYNCLADNLCVEGESINWDISITGTGKANIISARIQEKDNTNILAVYTPKKGESIEESETLIFSTLSSAPSESKEFIICFKLEIRESGSSLKGDVIDICDNQNVQEIQIIPSNEKECDMRFGNIGCDDDLNEVCIDYKCTNLQCGDCQYIKNNQCLDYECCFDNECGSNQLCEDNKCKLILCDTNQFAKDHECQTLICADDQYPMGGVCINLACADDEFAYEHSCKELECNFLESVDDHKCVYNNTLLMVVIIIVILFVVAISLLSSIRKYQKERYIDWDEYNKRIKK